MTSWRRMTSRSRHGLGTAGPPRPLQADTPVTWVTKVINAVGYRTSNGRFPKRENRKETGDRRQETGDRRQETGDRRQETGDRRQETGDRRQETGDRRQETGDRREQRAESREQRAEGRVRSAECRVQSAECRGQRVAIRREEKFGSVTMQPWPMVVQNAEGGLCFV